MTCLLSEHQEVIVLPTSPSLIDPSQSSRISSHNEPRLPRLPLPQYNGKHENWLPFRDQFESMVVNNQTISAVEKLQYLKCSLVGPAAQMLESTTLTAGNFIRSWENLIALYENPRQLIDESIDCLLDTRRNLQNLKCPVEHWDHLWVRIIVRQKLDLPTFQAWETYLGETTEPPTWNKFQLFIQTRIRTLQAIEKSKLQTSHPTSVQRQQSTGHSRQPLFEAHFASQNHNQNNKNYNLKSCVVCSELHYTSKCSLFKAKSVQQRLEFVNKRSLCFTCLGPHEVNTCGSTYRCFTCGRKHHTLLHQDQSAAKYDNKSQQSTAASPRQVHHLHQSHQEISNTNKTILLATARVRVVNNHGETIFVRALLDQRSEISLVSHNLVQHLHIRRNPSSVPILGIGARKSGRTKGIASLTIKPHFESSNNVTMNAHILTKLTSLIPSARITQPSWPHLKRFVLADPNFTEPGDIDLIIGADIYGHLLEGIIAKGPVNSPTAQSTKLGWIISGPTYTAMTAQSHSVHHYTIDYDLHSLLEKFWHQEEIQCSKAQVLSSMEQECENHFSTTHSRDETGRYIIRLPFKIYLDDIGDSRLSATRMLHHLFRKFESDSIYFDAYSSFLTEYELLHHMKRVPETDYATQSAFYLPHHGVVRESSSTTKLRVVFNGSCKVTGGKSLNEALHAGPIRQIDILDLTTVTYGLACAPFLALRSIPQLVEDEGHKFLLAVDPLLRGRYVDDVFGGADSIEEAQLKAQQVNNLYMAGGFPLRKWISNNQQVLKLIPSNHQLISDFIPIKDQVIYALGLSWNPTQDHFQFKFSSSAPPSSITKRKVLSEIAQFFDPLGLLSPLFIRAKICMQELWAIQLDWDDFLADPQLRTWQSLTQSLEGLGKTHITRWLGTTATCTTEIHGFSDASQLAMAAVVYIKTVHQNNEIKTSILCSKSKVAPLKRMTISRLELSAAVMLTKLTAHCLRTLNLVNTSCYLWTDSSIVHTWINNHPSRWKEFIHNRVCLIQETLPKAKWRYVPGTENPANCATRGLSAVELQKHTLWWKGPSWLAEPALSWPTTLSVSFSNLKERPTSLTMSFHTTKGRGCWDLLE